MLEAAAVTIVQSCSPSTMSSSWAVTVAAAPASQLVPSNRSASGDTVHSSPSTCKSMVTGASGWLVSDRENRACSAGSATSKERGATRIASDWAPTSGSTISPVHSSRASTTPGNASRSQGLRGLSTRGFLPIPLLRSLAPLDSPAGDVRGPSGRESIHKRRAWRCAIRDRLRFELRACKLCWSFMIGKAPLGDSGALWWWRQWCALGGPSVLSFPDQVPDLTTGTEGYARRSFLLVDTALAHHLDPPPEAAVVRQRQQVAVIAQPPTGVFGPRCLIVPGVAKVGVRDCNHIVCIFRQRSNRLPAQVDLVPIGEHRAIQRGQQRRGRQRCDPSRACWHRGSDLARGRGCRAGREQWRSAGGQGWLRCGGGPDRFCRLRSDRWRHSNRWRPAGGWGRCRSCRRCRGWLGRFTWSCRYRWRRRGRWCMTGSWYER